MRKFPQNKIWNQDNNSDLYSDIWSSWGIDISAELGKLKAKRTLSVARSVDDGTDNYTNGLGLAVAFRYFSGQHFAATDGTISKCGTSRTSAWGLDTTSGKPTTVSSRYSDMEVFNDNLYVTANTTNILYKWTGSVWSNIAVTGQDSAKPHAMCVFASRLYVQTDYAKINSCGTNDTFGATIGTSANTIDLGNPTSNTITFLRAGIKAGQHGIWIGTVNRNGGKGHVYFWDGVSTGITTPYKLESSGAMAGVVKDDVLYIMDNDGRLLAFNGGTFTEIDRLPIKDGKYLFFALGEYNERWIHPNGMTVRDSSILILIDNEYRGASANSEENVSSGIWEWTKETGLYCKYPLSLTNHDATTLKDYGQNRISKAGALAYIKSSDTSATDNGSLLAGAQLFYDESNTENHILIDDLNDTYEKFTYFITPRILSTDIEDVWQKLIPRFKEFLGDNDAMWVKNRTSIQEPLVITITTWSGSNSIRTSTDPTAYSAGDEVEILQGEAGGRCFEIESITDLTGGVWEIKFTESFTGVSGEGGKARLQKWRTLRKYEGDEDKFEASIESSKSWVQLKICLKWTGDNELLDMFLINKLHKATE